MTEINQLFDKTFKKVLTLSSKAVIRFVNGLFDTDYPLDSEITYNWTEFEDEALRRILADTIITINHQHSYHIEAQMTEDNEIIFRMFDYGYSHAFRTRVVENDKMILRFPEPKIIYLYSEKNVPREITLQLDFGTQGMFEYKVNTLDFLYMTTDELNKKGLIILIPFQLLKLRKMLNQSRSEQNITALKQLLRNDIIGSISSNYMAGNISYSDAASLRAYTQIMYDQIYYSQYEELGEMDDMTDESYMTDIDLIIKEQDDKWEGVVKERNRELRRLDTELKNKSVELKDKEQALKEKNDALKELDDILKDKDAKLKDKDAKLRDKDAEIRRLKRLLSLDKV